MPRFDNNADFQKFEAQNMRVQNLAGAPATPVVGQLYVETTGGVNRLYQFDGAAWVLKATDSDRLGGQTSAFHRDRANHTGSQIAATISDLAATVQGYALSSFAVPTAAINFNGQDLTGLPATPGTASSATSKTYVDNLVNGLDWKASVRAATTAALPAYTATATVLTASTSGAFPSIDGAGIVVNDRVLVKDETGTLAPNNGIFTLTNAGSSTTAWVLTRSADADSNAEVTSGMATFVEQGTANGNQQWVLTTDNPITVGTTALTFAQVGATGSAPAAGNGLELVSNTYNVVAGTGITVGADTVGIDTASATPVARRFTTLYGNGDGTTTTYDFTHGLASQFVTVQVYDVSGTTPVMTWPDISLPTSTTVRVTHGAPVAPSARRVVITG